MALRCQFVHVYFLSKFLRYQISQRRMWPLLVVVILPIFERFFGFCQRGKQVFIQALIPQLAVEAFDKAILLGPSKQFHRTLTL